MVRVGRPNDVSSKCSAHVPGPPATLDIVGQSPGSPEEDPRGFPFGGWQAPLLDEVTGAQILAAYEGTDALLLGRRTYDIFVASWPSQEDGEDNKIASSSTASRSTLPLVARLLFRGLAPP